MTNSGNNLIFEASFFPWSGRSGFEAQVFPYGIATGGELTASTTADTVSIGALSAYMPGASAADPDGMVTVAADDVTITRATTDTHLIRSLVINPDGSLAAIEIGQIRLTNQTTATVATTEIYQVDGVHRERSDSPVWKTDFTTGEITFASALPPIHTGNTTKAVTVKGYTPIFAESPRVSDFVPAEESNSVSSTEIYGGTLGSVSKSLGQGKFTHYGNDGITDPLVKAKGQKLWFKFIQDKNKTPYSLTQGILGIARTFPAGKHVQISCTISAEQPTTDFDG